MEPAFQYRVAQNEKEYLEICKETFIEEIFDTVDEWLHFFEIPDPYTDDKYDEIEDWKEVIKAFDGSVGRKPEQNEYPLLVVYGFKKEEDPRQGILTMEAWDWVPLRTLQLKKT